MSDGRYIIYRLKRRSAVPTKTLLDHLANLKVHEDKKETIEQTLVSFEGNPGIKFTIKNSAWRLFATGYLFLIDDDLHELVASGADYQLDSPRNRWLLGSFRIREKNGPGLVLGSMITDPSFLAVMPKTDVVPAIPLPNQGRIWISENLQLEAWLPGVGFGSSSVRQVKGSDGKTLRTVMSDGTGPLVYAMIHEVAFPSDVADQDIFQTDVTPPFIPKEGISLGPFTGVEGDTRGDNLKSKRRFVVNHVLYQLEIVRGSPEERDLFFASFRPRVPGTPTLKLGSRPK